MIKVKISTDFPYEPILRQTPGSSGIWGPCRFFVNQPVDECDYWVVFNGVLQSESTLCPPQNTILVTAEPPDIRGYDAAFIRQFGTLMTFHRNLPHPRIIYTHPALNWHVGRIITSVENRESIITRTYDDFKAQQHFDKKRLISVISSDKTFTSGHRRRLDFVRALQSHFGDQIAVYGKGINEVADKWDAIADFKYHVAIENSYLSHYWTEKLGDAYLAGAYPIYYGCPNLEQYFPAGSFSRIDINNPGQAIQTIERCINSGQYEASLPKINQARQRVLDEYNMFAMIANHVQRKGPRKITIRAGQPVSSVVYRVPGAARKRRVTIRP